MHDATLPAGYIAEAFEDVDAKVNIGEIDFLGIHRAERRQRIWAALREPQADREAEVLRVHALRRSMIAIVLGLAIMGLLVSFFVFVLSALLG
ncbi:MAG: hypothetical protein LC748_00220 [Thermomicrobia bacterium]|nr:hypothetical protein [Thermomicrobia bacterium]